MMTEQEDNQDEPKEYRSFSGLTMNKIVAILFVLGIYLIIFLKILILD